MSCRPNVCLLFLGQFLPWNADHQSTAQLRPSRHPGEFMGDTPTSQFIPASPGPSLGDSLGKITCTRMKKNTLCLGHIKVFHEVKPSTTLTAWGGGEAVIPGRPRDPPHSGRHYCMPQRKWLEMVTKIVAIAYTEKFLRFLLERSQQNVILGHYRKRD